VWLDRVKAVYKDNLQITWKNFSLEQNAFALKQKAEGTESDWKVWDDPNANERRSLIAQIAAEAVRTQGEEAYEKYHLALLIARHGGQGRAPLNDVDVLVKIAEDIGLDGARLREDMKDPALAQKIGRDHEQAVSLGIFGTPTFLFEDGNVAFLKTFIPPAEDSIGAFNAFMATASQRSYIGEIKRPQPPWPKGAF
jgi:predicted DsbA family dithiol-disulfide isomerase